MKRTSLSVPAGFLKSSMRSRLVSSSATRAILAANAELVRLYWDIGRMIGQPQRRASWGAGMVPRLARELRNALPEVKGFAERNIKLMVQFAHEYPDAFTASPAVGQPAVAQLPVVTDA